jgi:Ca2+/H+ antiporter
MEIGSAYALQVCLLQIPAMVAFSAIYDPVKMGEYVDTFTCVLSSPACATYLRTLGADICPSLSSSA